jgi:hypothetical protein
MEIREPGAQNPRKRASESRNIWEKGDRPREKVYQANKASREIFRKQKLE